MNKINKQTNFVINSIKDILSQFEISDKISLDKIEIYISTKNHNHILNILLDEKALKFALPVKADKVVKAFLLYQSHLDFKFGPLLFNPSKQLLFNKDLQTTLRHSHSIMLNEIITNQENGISKSILYEKLWPNDKDIQMNKLDTHLTNLKKAIYENFNYEIILKTVNGKLIIID